MDIKRALAVSQVAGTIIESAKAEIAFMEATGEQVDTDFFGELGEGRERRPRLMGGGGR